jgi:hypothetical protein
MTPPPKISNFEDSSGFSLEISKVIFKYSSEASLLELLGILELQIYAIRHTLAMKTAVPATLKELL